MSLIPFNELPDVARLWVFNTDTLLDSRQSEQIESSLGRFLEQWTAHRLDVPAGFDIRDGRFILIAADTRETGTAGCSIDSMMAFIRDMQTQLGITILDAPDVCYRAGESVECITRPRFEELASSGEVNATTVVFDNTVTSIEDLRNGRWEKPAGESWHARAFDLKNAETANAGE